MFYFKGTSTKDQPIIIVKRHCSHIRKVPDIYTSEQLLKSVHITFESDDSTNYIPDESGVVVGYATFKTGIFYYLKPLHDKIHNTILTGRICLTIKKCVK